MTDWDDRLPRSPSSSVIADGHGKNFERARNTRDLGMLGDPERWGGATEVFVRMPVRQNPSQVQSIANGEQCVRVQTPDLIARVWQSTVSWNLLSAQPLASIANFALFLAVDVAWGSGQARQAGRLFLWEATQNGFFLPPSPPAASGGQPSLTLNSPRFNSRAQSGTFFLPDFPGAVLVMTPVILYQDNSAIATAYEVRLNVTLGVAPRAL